MASVQVGDDKRKRGGATSVVPTRRKAPEKTGVTEILSPSELLPPTVREPPLIPPAAREALDLSPKLAALLVVVTLAFALSHETGYFTVIGQFFQTFATYYDYMVNALIWLPATFMLLNTFFVINDIERQNKPDGFHFGLTMKVLIGIYVVFALLSILIGASIAFETFMIISIFLCWFLTNLIPPSRFFMSSSFAYKVMIFIPAVIVAVFGYGINQGYKDLKKTDDVYRISYKDGRPSQNIIMLRNFDRGFLVHNTVDKRIDFALRENVLSLSRVSIQTSISMPCKWFDLFCGKHAIPPRL